MPVKPAFAGVAGRETIALDDLLDVRDGHHMRHLAIDGAGDRGRRPDRQAVGDRTGLAAAMPGLAQDLRAVGVHRVGDLPRADVDEGGR